MEENIKRLLFNRNIEINKTESNTVLKLLDNLRVAELNKAISESENQIIEIFHMYRDREFFKENQLFILNANAKKEYDYIFDLSDYPNIIIKEIKGLDNIGLAYDSESMRIHGTPKVANTIDLQIVFYNKLDPNQVSDIKIIPFIINADPKDLWLDKESDKGAKYAKTDFEIYSGNFLDKKIVVASKRGRSHAHEGLFRDDDFKVETLSDGWAIITVADGAGSAKYAREGSKLATEIIISKFSSELVLDELNKSVVSYYNTENVIEVPVPESEKVQESEEILNTDKLETDNNKVAYKNSIINILYKSVVAVHNDLRDFSIKEEIQLKELNTTLIFALCKKYDFGYVLLTFGVGDCPINIINTENSHVDLLNTLDVGDFGGGTRFITMGEIFNNSNMANRFSINMYDDFSKLFLMTDGIYDPKFVTENKLEDIETWSKFLVDLDGLNEEKIKVDFTNDVEIAAQLLNWMDFWSKGNHDDRTLAIVY